MVDGLKDGNVESAKNAIEAMYRTLRYAAGRQNMPQFEKNYLEGGMTLMQHFMEALDDGAISIVSGSHTSVEDDLDAIALESVERHWRDKGQAFCEDVAKQLKDMEGGLKKENEGRAILERKAAAFDEIAMQMKSVYKAVHALDGSFGSDEERKNVPYATMRAMFSLGIIAEIIGKTKEDTI